MTKMKRHDVKTELEVCIILIRKIDRGSKGGIFVA